jgi:hypothetical protein
MVFNELVPSTMRSWIDGAVRTWNMSGSALTYGAVTFASNWASQPVSGQYASFTSLGFNNTVPGVSQGMHVSPHSTGRMTLNSNFTWRTNGDHSVPWNIADVATVVVHETGHLNGLTHPEVCGQYRTLTADEQASVMRVIDIGIRRALSADDVAYQQWRY